MRLAPISPRTLCGALVIATVSGTTLAAPAPTQVSPISNSLRWANGISDRVNIMTPAQLKSELDHLSKRQDATRVLVTLNQAITDTQRATLQTQGLTLLSPLGSTNYFATLSRDANTTALAQSTLASVSSIKSHQKLHKDLIAGVIHPWAVSNQGPVAKSSLKDRMNTESILLDEYNRQGIDPTIAVVVMFHKDANFNPHALRLANELGAKVASEIYSVNSAILHIPASRLNELASDDAVMWAEPPLPGMTTLNAENRVLTGVNTLQTAPYNLDGSGVTALIYDAGRMANHTDFGSRLTVGQSDTSGISGHATHVGGTVGGDGSASSGNNRGMAPAVDLISYGFEQAGGLQEGFLYTDPGDIEADYTEAIGLYSSVIANNSIGTNTAPNGYPCDWTGNYGITSALIDSIVQGSLGDPFRIVWANGNERGSSRCQGDDNGNFGQFFSTAPPACAKNHITVGSVDSNTDLTSSFSSWGPTDDGRIKPDISAPGCQTNGDGGVTSTSSSGGYTTFCGTSMASPTTTGISALILQQYRASFPDRTDLRNSTLKALLANTADDSGNIGPDYKYGYGSIRAVDAIDTVIAGNIIEAEVAQGNTYRFVVIHQGGDLKVTIAWDDAPGSPNVSPSLVNDLDLKIIDAGSNVHLPWTLNPSNPGGVAVRTVRDGLNNIEQVAIDNAPAGAYTVEVVGFNIAQGPTQSFGAVANGFLVNCSSGGLISLGSQLVQCSGTTGVQVIDCDLNTSDSIIDTVDVMISSDSDAGFMLTLTESAPESAAFLATFSFSDSGGSDLLVNEGDTVTAAYLDANDGSGGSNVLVESTMVVDCSPPAIINVATSNIEPRSATVDAGTDEAARVTVNYGLSMFSLNDSVTSGAFNTVHSINIAGLTDNTTYFYSVSAEDQAGNSTTDDNSGLGYTFTTPDIPDFFTEQFDGSIDLEGLTLTLTPSPSVEGYEAAIEPLAGGVLPFEPTNGTPLPLTDDDSEFVSITGGNTVEIYGQSFSSFHVGSNGYVTFSASDTDFSESIGDHFDTPRVSGIFDDLNPSDAGTVYYQQLADRMVISWDAVTEFFAGNQNTFQIELHFDGTIVISWERLDTNDCIVGISEGVGEDPDFIQSDLSTYPAPNNCQADFTGDGALDFFDISAFLTLFSSNDPSADINQDGQWDFFDISSFLTLFSAGCP